MTWIKIRNKNNNKIKKYEFKFGMFLIIKIKNKFKDKFIKNEDNMIKNMIIIGRCIDNS
jgi:hypothetical protein